MASWVRTITSPFRKARTLFSVSSPNDRDKKHTQGSSGRDPYSMSLHGEVMACTYEDVRVMWSLLDKSRPPHHHVCNSGS